VRIRLMGDFEAYDCMTRLPIYIGEKVLAIYGMNPKKKDGWVFNPLFGQFSPSNFDYIRFFKGTYNGHGGLNEIEDNDLYISDGELVFMHEDTLEFVQSETEKHPNFMQCYYDKKESSYDENWWWSEIGKELQDVVKDYGAKAFYWAIGQYAYDKFGIDGDKSFDEFLTFLVGFEGGIKDGTRKVDDLPQFRKYASEWKEYIYPITYFCINNRIMLDATIAYNGHQTKGNEELEANLRFNSFTLSQTRKTMKKHWNPDGERTFKRVLMWLKGIWR